MYERFRKIVKGQVSPAIPMKVLSVATIVEGRWAPKCNRHYKTL